MARRASTRCSRSPGTRCGSRTRRKVYFPKPGWTKLDLVTYYLTAADAVLIHLRERPTVMKRFVNGIMEDPIWQKRVPKNLPEWLQTTTVAFPSGRTAEELVANDEAHLAWAVNLGVIDFNPHPVRRADLDHPDELRVDLDPTPDVGWDEVRRTAMVANEVLDRARPARLSEDVGLQGHPHQRADRAASGRISRCAGPRWRSRARSSAARPTWRRASGGRRSATACSSTTTRTRAIAPWRPAYSVRPTPDARVSTRPALGRGAQRRARRPAHRHGAGPAEVHRRSGGGHGPRARLAGPAARPRPPRRGGRARRRAVAAALPEDEGRAQAGAAEPRHRPPAAARPRRRPAARRAAARDHVERRSAGSAQSPGPARATSTSSTE